MAWYLFFKNDTGDLVSEGDVIPEGLDTNVYGTLDVGTRPNWVIKGWNPSLRQLFDVPLPLVIDRLDDIHARLLNDADFVAVWNALNATRRTQLRTGIARILALCLGSRRWRQEDESVELA